MTKSRRQELSDKFTEQWQQCRDWLLPHATEPAEVLDEDELRRAAMCELKVSKSTFDFWVEGCNRRQWPTRLVRAAAQRLRTKS
jgi:hypothetical protein